ncbi:hypothetical protein PENTCL1PPCAC_25120, partial [Pristionchus entomophagus]
SRKMLLPWLCFSLLITAALAKEILNVLVISDFSLAFVRPLAFDRSLLPSGPFVCPSSAYPDALSQFQFTSDVIANVDRTIPMKIQYYVYSGGDGDPIGNIFSSRDNFTETSIPAYTKFCAEGPENNDFERFIKLTITPSINTDLLILFTAAPQTQIDNALPILSSKVKKVIVLGLNGRDVSNAYPYSSVTLTDFTEPERASCMVNELYETIHGKLGDVDAVALCYPPKELTTIIPVETETPPNPPITIIFINDFTSDYLQDYQSTIRAKRTSNAIKCPGNAHSEASSEFDFTNEILQNLDISMEIYYYAYNGENRNIPPPIDIDNFQTDTEFKDVVCGEDNPLPSNLNSLVDTIAYSGIDFDLLVLLSAAPQSQFDSAFPHPYGDAKVITVGLKGASAFDAYPETATIIDDFAHPEVITCMIETALSRQGNPVEVCGAKTRPPPMTILFVNDFTSDFVGDQMIAKNIPISKAIYGKCPGGMYIEAGKEFNFTVDIVNGIRADANLNLMFNEYNGDDRLIDSTVYPRDIFAETASMELRESCLDDHYPSDLQKFASDCLQYVTAEVLVLFTAQNLDQPLPVSSNIGRIIVVGLNGADQSAAYPDSSIPITDFSHPEVVSCMIDRLWDDIADNSLLSCVPIMNILFINDFTTDFIVDTPSFSSVGKTSNAFKCSGGMSPPGSVEESDFTNYIVQSIDDSLKPNIFYYAYNGDYFHPIPLDPSTKEDFATGSARNEFRDYACDDDDRRSIDLPSLIQLIYQFEANIDIDIIVLFSAATPSQFDSAFPLTYGEAKLITVGLKGASAFNAYPNTSTVINDFSQPEVITCMIEAAYRGDENPAKVCGARQQRPPMSILFINDFTTDFVVDDAMSKKVPISNLASYGKCPGGMYIEAGNEFNYTVDIVNRIRSEADLVLLFSEYLGGWDYSLESAILTRDDFAVQASSTLRDACIEDHFAPDYDALAMQLSFIRTDVLVLFTATALNTPLVLPAGNFGRFIVVGLNGADQSKAYPDSSISITEFSRPQVISCMIDKLWDDIASNSLLSCAN